MANERLLFNFGFPSYSDMYMQRERKNMAYSKPVKAEKNENFEPREPDFKADGIAVWQNKDKNGKDFLSIKIVGHTTVFAFKYEPKEE